MEILATILVYDYPIIYTICLGLSLVIGIVMGLAFILGSVRDGSWLPLITGILCIVLGVIGITHSSRAIEKNSYVDYVKYKVTINESITAQEFLNKYEVLYREGEIFTIKEIEVAE